MPKKKKELVIKTSEDIYIDALTAWVEQKLQREVWAEEDRKLKEMGKKLTGKDLIRQNAQRKYQLATSVQKEREKLIKEYSERILQFRKTAIEKEARDKSEQTDRMEQLKESCYEIQELERMHFEKEQELMDEEAWQEYIKCDGLPNPLKPGEMNTYLNVWDKVKEEATLQDTIQRTSDVLQLLDKLTDYMVSPVVSDKKKRLFLEVENDIKIAQQKSLDRIVYKLLRDISHNMGTLENIKVATFEHTDVYFSISLWALVQLPIPMYNPKREKREIEKMFFPQMLLGLEFPDELDVWAMCLRAMNVSYDHFSSLSGSYLPPETPDLFRMNLIELCEMEWSERLLIMDDLEKKRASEPTVVTRPPLPFVKDVNDTFPKTVSEIYLDREETMIEEILLPALRTEVGKHELNLREFRITGGVYYIELLYQPPQPVEPVLREIQFASLLKPKWLQQVPFKVEIRKREQSIASDDSILRNWIAAHDQSQASIKSIGSGTKKSKSTESTRKGMKSRSAAQAKQSASTYSTTSRKSNASKRATALSDWEGDEEESEFFQNVEDKCVYIELILPQTILWLVEPTVTQWDDDLNIWTVEYIFNIYYERASSKLSFRTGRFGRFALAIPRYCSLPYRHWEIGPHDDDQIKFQLETPQLDLVILIDSETVCLQELIGAPNKALDSIVGERMSFKNFKKILQQRGLDIFPEIDAGQCVPGISEKPWPLEKHTYFNMALCCQYYFFARSRWNIKEIRRNILINVKEWSKYEDVARYETVMITPMRSYYIIGDDRSLKLDTTPHPKTKFYADFIHLIRGTQSGLIKNRMRKTPIDLVNNVAYLLCAIRPLSFS